MWFWTKNLSIFVSLLENYKTHITIMAAAAVLWMMENYVGNCENSQCQDFHNNSRDGRLKKILTNLQFPDFSVLKEIVINVTVNSLLIVIYNSLIGELGFSASSWLFRFQILDWRNFLKGLFYLQFYSKKVEKSHIHLYLFF